MAPGYSSRDVADLLDIPVEQIRSLVRSGFLDPGRGDRGEYRFDFRDLVLLRTAKHLLEKQVSTTKIRRALAELKRQIPEDRPLTSVELDAVGAEVVAREGNVSWLPVSGQAVFTFDATPATDKVRRLIPRRPSSDPVDRDMSAEDWFELGCELETGAPKQARDAYRRALELRPEYPEVRVNLGRLLHQAGELEAAEAHYRIAAAERPEDPTAAYNLGVVLEDLGRSEHAIAAYERAIGLEPLYRDAYYNLARLLEKLHRHQDALRILGQYRKLTEG